MNNNYTLLILAAGLSKRYGNKLKQFETIGSHGEFIMDYNITNAIKVGFKKVVLIIRKENYKLLKETINKRLQKSIQIDYAFQESIEEKTLGTAHAIMSAKEIIQGSFLVINADDLYNIKAFKKAYKNLKKLNNNNCFTVGYKINNTITKNGKVKRGICKTKGKNITELQEKEIYKEKRKIKSSDNYKIRKNTYVSMNMLGFTDEIFQNLEKEYKLHINNNKNEEFQITEVLNKLINRRKIKMTLIKTKCKWYGLTYKEDLEILKRNINKIIK